MVRFFLVGLLWWNRFFFVVFLSLSFLPGGCFVVGFLCCGIIIVLCFFAGVLIFKLTN